jgi:hypothetical protein
VDPAVSVLVDWGGDRVRSRTTHPLATKDRGGPHLAGQGTHQFMSVIAGRIIPTPGDENNSFVIRPKPVRADRLSPADVDGRRPRPTDTSGIRRTQMTPLNVPPSPTGRGRRALPAAAAWTERDLSLTTTSTSTPKSDRTPEGSSETFNLSIRFQEAPAAPAPAALASCLRPGGAADEVQRVLGDAGSLTGRSGLRDSAARSSGPSGFPPAAWRPWRGTRCRRRPGHALGCQVRLMPSRAGVGVANLAPPVTSGSGLCVRVGEEGGRERRGWPGLVGERSAHVHHPPRSRFAGPWRRRQTLPVLGHAGAWRSSCPQIEPPPCQLPRTGAASASRLRAAHSA